jgi:hypothetical protein
VITTEATQIDCREREIDQYLKSNKSLLIIGNNKAEIHRISFIKDLNLIERDNDFLNFAHLSDITSEIDIAMAIHNQMKHKIGTLIHEEVPTQEGQSKLTLLTQIAPWVHKIEDMKSKYWTYVKGLVHINEVRQI